MKLTIFVGRAEPLIAIGKHQCAALGFAEKYRGWHSFAKNKATVSAVRGLERRGSIQVNWKLNQYRCA